MIEDRHRSELYLAWTGTDNRLNVGSSSDGVHFGKITLPESSFVAPVIEDLSGTIYLSWTGTDNHLNLISSSDGITFSHEVTLPESSFVAPALIEDRHRSKLYLAWTGTDNCLTVGNITEPDKSGPASPLYTFTLDSFKILNTRAWHNDTDSVAISLRVVDKDYGTVIRHIGDVNNGTHNVGLGFRAIPVDQPSTPVVFTFQIVNAGHVPQQNGAEVVAGFLAGFGVTAAPVSAPLLIAAGTLEALNLVYSVITVNCDGVVAAGGFMTPRSDIDTLLNIYVYTNTVNFPDGGPGGDSPHGCGRNSNYKVTYSVSKSSL